MKTYAVTAYRIILQDTMDACSVRYLLRSGVAAALVLYELKICAVMIQGGRFKSVSHWIVLLNPNWHMFQRSKGNIRYTPIRASHFSDGVWKLGVHIPSYVRNRTTKLWH